MAVQFNPFTGNLDIVGAGTSTTPGGSDTQVQFNDGGSFGGSADLTWDDTAKELGVGGDINLDDGGTYSTTLQMVTATANRTISFPDATGTVALVAGSSSAVQFNSAGALAGDANLTWSTTTGLALGKPLNVNIAGAASTPSVSFLGTWFTGGTSTTTKPKLLIEPSGTTSTGWSTAGTGLGINAASGFTGNLLDAQTNGTSIFSVGSVGNTSSAFAWRIGASSVAWAPFGGATAFGAAGGNPAFTVEGALGAGIPSAALLWWASSATSGAYSLRDVVLARDAAGTLAQRNGTNAQTYRLYNTYTDASNYERHSHSWSGNVLNIANEAAGTGTLRGIAFSQNGTASTPPAAFTGTWFTGGTSTTTKPQLLIEPTGTTSTAWSTSGTGLGINAASGFAGNLLDLQVNGAQYYTFSTSAANIGGINIPVDINILTGGGKVLRLGGGSSSTIWFTPGNMSGYRMNASGHFYPNTSNTLDVGIISNPIRSLYAGTSIGFSDGVNADIALLRDAANTLAQRNGTNAQTYHLYNTYTDASNYERGFLRWSSNVFEIGSEGAGTGSEKPVRITAATLKLPNLPTYADNAAATTGGLVAGDVYKTATGELRITV